MKAKTTASEQVWQSSDGQRTIWEVTLRTDDGKEYRLKTYSKDIASKEFEGEVETYAAKNGDRFVRQPKPENGYTGGKGSKQNNQPIIQAQWAIGRAATIIQQRGELLPDEEYWQTVEQYAVKLIEVANRIVGGSERTNPKAPDIVHTVTGDEDDEVIERYIDYMIAEEST